MGTSRIIWRVESVACRVSVHIPGKIVKNCVHVFSSISSGFGGICRFLRPKRSSSILLCFILRQLSMYSTWYVVFWLQNVSQRSLFWRHPETWSNTSLYVSARVPYTLHIIPWTIWFQFPGWNVVFLASSSPLLPLVTPFSIETSLSRCVTSVQKAGAAWWNVPRGMSAPSHLVHLCDYKLFVFFHLCMWKLMFLPFSCIFKPNFWSFFPRANTPFLLRFPSFAGHGS